MDSLHLLFAISPGRTNSSCSKGIAASELKLANVGNVVALFLLHLHLGRLAFILFKRLGIPRPMIQMISGVFVGMLGDWISPYTSSEGFIAPVTKVTGMSFSFLMGLEMDTRQLWPNRRLPLVFLASNVGTGMVVAAPIHVLLIQKLSKNLTLGDLLALYTSLLIVVSNSSAAIIVRMCAEVKIATTDLGRTAIVTSLVNDIACLFIIAFFDTPPDKPLPEYYAYLLLFVPLIIAAGVLLLRIVAYFLNHLNPHRRTIKFSEMVFIAFFVFLVCRGAEAYGLSMMVSSFAMGLCFPREGKTGRTLMAELTELVHNVLLPVYFSLTGSQLGVLPGRNGNYLPGVAYGLVASSFLVKLVSTMAAAACLRMKFVEGFTLGFLLNVKGHVDIFVLNIAKNRGIMDETLYLLILRAIVAVCIVTGPLVAIIIRLRRRAHALEAVAGLETAPPNNQIHLLACVYSATHMPATLNLVEMSRDADLNCPFSIHLMHLIELTEQTASDLLFHQRPEEDGDEENHGGEDAHLVREAADAFTRETGMPLHLLKAVSDFRNMHEDICNASEDVRASVVLLPYHKHRRCDGRMELTNEGYRATNHKVLERVRCTVALLVDRGIGGANAREGAQQHVAALFFGGADDREALSYAAFLAGHPAVTLTVVRFLSALEKENGVGGSSMDERLSEANAKAEAENSADREFLDTYYERYVTSGLVSFVEKYVEDSAATITALSSMDGMYSLYIVGKGGPNLSPLMAGISEWDWEVSPELGTIGDLLASPDFMGTGSVLVVQQRKTTNKNTAQAADVGQSSNRDRDIPTAREQICSKRDHDIQAAAHERISPNRGQDIQAENGQIMFSRNHNIQSGNGQISSSRNSDIQAADGQIISSNRNSTCLEIVDEVETR